MKNRLIIALLIGISIMNACNESEKEIDTTKPTIEAISESFPLICDTIYFGESFELKYLLKDNVELGSYSMDIHNNFDHHTHSTEIVECDLGVKKEPVNPFVFIEDYSIPSGRQDFTTNVMISIPNGNDVGLFDEGDYHFQINLTDAEGWATQIGLSIKMAHRN